MCLYKNYCYWHKIERALISLQVETSRSIVGSCHLKNATPFKNICIYTYAKVLMCNSQKTKLFLNKIIIGAPERGRGRGEKM